MKDRYTIEEFSKLHDLPETTTPQSTNQSTVGFKPWVNYEADFFDYTNETSVPRAMAKGAIEGAAEGLVNSVGNMIPSAVNFGKNIWNVVTNPIDTTKSIYGVVKGGIQKAAGQENQDTQSFDAFAGQLKDQYGSLEGLSNYAQNDPFSLGLDIYAAGGTVAGLTGKGTQYAQLTSKTGQLVTTPIKKFTSGLSQKVGQTTRFGVSQATGLSPQTVSTIVNRPDDFAKVRNAGTTRVDLADNVLQAINKASDELSDLGAGYQAIRSSGATVNLGNNWMQSVLDKYGLKLDKGKVVADRSSRTRNITDINALQKLVDDWGDARILNADQYLNLRHDLAELAKYDSTGKSTIVRQFAQDLREGVLNADDVRTQIPGLKELDVKYAPDKQFYDQIRRDFIDPKTGNLKDGAASKVVNAINSANPERLDRLEKLYPGFADQARLVKAAEDVEAAMGLKVGSYVRAGVAGGGVLTGNMPLIVSAIISTPEVAVPLLQAYGYTAKNVAPILRAVRAFGDDINNFRVPGGVREWVENYNQNGASVGLSIKSSVRPDLVAKKIDSEDLSIIRKYVNNPADKQNFGAAMRLIQEIGLDKADDATQMRFLQDVLYEYANR